MPIMPMKNMLIMLRMDMKNIMTIIIPCQQLKGLVLPAKLANATATETVVPVTVAPVTEGVTKVVVPQQPQEEIQHSIKLLLQGKDVLTKLK